MNRAEQLARVPAEVYHVITVALCSFAVFSLVPLKISVCSFAVFSLVPSLVRDFIPRIFHRPDLTFLFLVRAYSFFDTS